MTSTASLFDQCVSTMTQEDSQAIVNNGKAAGYGKLDDGVRYHASEPLYSAVWVFTGANEVERDYSPVHVHNFPELNVLAGAPGELVYRIRIGDEEREVVSPASILIPAGVSHSANLVRGTGSFVVFRLVPEQLANFNSVSLKT